MEGYRELNDIIDVPESSHPVQFLYNARCLLLLCG